MLEAGDENWDGVNDLNQKGVFHYLDLKIVGDYWLMKCRFPPGWLRRAFFWRPCAGNLPSFFSKMTVSLNCYLTRITIWHPQPGGQTTMVADPFMISKGLWSS